MIVYIYIVSILLLLFYTGFVYFITEKYQPREADDSSKFRLLNASFSVLHRLVNTPLFPDAQRPSGPIQSVMSRIDSMARRWKADVEQQRNTVFKRRVALQ